MCKFTLSDANSHCNSDYLTSIYLTTRLISDLERLFVMSMNSTPQSIAWVNWLGRPQLRNRVEMMIASQQNAGTLLPQLQLRVCFPFGGDAWLV